MAETVSITATAPILDVLDTRLSDEPFWRRRLEHAEEGGPHVHLAIFHEPFLSLLLAGKKTVESRFSVNRIAPFGVVARDDLILLKRSTGPIVGIALAGDPGFYELDPDSWATIRRRFAAAICAPDEGFWAARAHARYATLIPIKAAVAVAPFPITKRDRRGWVLLPPPLSCLERLRA
ncbi:MAG: ASCH domain-containing protein [Gaiellaceae bacterium]